MANAREVNLYVEAKRTTGLYLPVNEATLKDTVRAALTRDGWQIGQIYGGNSLLQPEWYALTIQAFVLNQYSDQQVQDRMRTILEQIHTPVNYGLWTSEMKTFADVRVRILTGDPNHISTKELDDKDFLTNFAKALGTSTPIALVIGALGIVVFLKLTK